MVVFVIENSPEKLRGELTRWLIEIKAGVFIGKVSAMVRDKLWNKVENERPALHAVQIYDANNEQGYIMKVLGEPHRNVIDMEGLQLIKVVK